MPKITNDWLDAIGEEFNKPYYLKLREFLIREYNTRTIFPVADDIFNAYHMTSYSDVKVVILGQDPYHNYNQAHGLAFSVKEDAKIPPSLENIYKELNSDLGLYIPNNGNLEKWSKQGVLLLNTVLTVRAHEANSHKNMGWEIFTDKTIISLNKKKNPVIFMLWGSHAQKKEALITNPNHYILKAPHPSPLSAYRGFFGCRHFSKANQILVNNGLSPIDWQIENI